MQCPVRDALTRAAMLWHLVLNVSLSSLLCIQDLTHSHVRFSNFSGWQRSVVTVSADQWLN